MSDYSAGGFGVSEASMLDHVKQTCDAIYKAYKVECFTDFSSPAQLERVCSIFLKPDCKGGLHNCAGAIDCTHMEIGEKIRDTADFAGFYDRTGS